MDGVPGWLGNCVQRKLYDNPRFATVRAMYFGDKHPLTEEGSKIEYVAGDIRNYSKCLELTKDMNILVHIVGIIHPKKVKDFYNINVKGTDTIIRAAIENGVERIIHISSNSVYGMYPYSMNEFTPRDSYMHYGKSKAMGEDIVFQKCMVSDTEAVILIPCWFYGEGQPDRSTRLFKMIAKGNPMIFGKGNNVRGMTYIGNLADAIIKAIEKPKSEGVNSYWICDDEQHTTNEIYKAIWIELWKRGIRDKGKAYDDMDVWKFKPRYLPSVACKVGRFGDRVLQGLGLYNQTIHVLGEMDQNIAADNTLAKRELGWKNNVSFEEGIARSIQWCRENGKL